MPPTVGSVTLHRQAFSTLKASPCAGSLRRAQSPADRPSRCSAPSREPAGRHPARLPDDRHQVRRKHLLGSTTQPLPLDIHRHGTSVKGSGPVCAAAIERHRPHLVPDRLRSVRPHRLGRVSVRGCRRAGGSQPPNLPVRRRGRDEPKPPPHRSTTRRCSPGEPSSTTPERHAPRRCDDVPVGFLRGEWLSCSRRSRPVATTVRAAGRPWRSPR